MKNIEGLVKDVAELVNVEIDEVSQYHTAIVIDGKNRDGYLIGDSEMFEHPYGFYQLFITDNGDVLQVFYDLDDLDAMDVLENVDLGDVDYSHPFYSENYAERWEEIEIARNKNGFAKIWAQDHGCNIVLHFGYGDFDMDHDGCIDFTREVNLNYLYVEIEDYLERDLDAEEKEEVERAVMTWIDCNSAD